VSGSRSAGTGPVRRWGLAVIAALAASALAGCYEYARVSMRNAPGVTDLSKPPERENGAPERFEQATSPGAQALAVIPTLSGMLGVGRGPVGHSPTVEPGLEVRFERYTGRERQLLGARAFAMTAGIGFVQGASGQPTIAGPLFLEANYRTVLAKTWPVDLGLGPVVYPSELDAGAQLTVRITLLAIRARYLADSGFEFFGGLQVPIPFFFERSR
jgi:hypothetical protein